MDVLKTFLNYLFSSLPVNADTERAKNELYQMMEDKYTELVEDGMSEEEAIKTVQSEFGSLEEVADELGIGDWLAKKPEAGRTQMAGQPQQAQQGPQQAQQGPQQAQQGPQTGAPVGAQAQTTEKKKSHKGLIIGLSVGGGCLILAIICTVLICGLVLGRTVSKSAKSAMDITGQLVSEMENPEDIDVEAGSDLFDYFNKTELKLHVDVSLADVTVERGDSLSVSYSCPAGFAPESTLRGKELTVKQAGKTNLNLEGLESQITITIPDTVTTLTLVDVSDDLGDFNMEGFDCSELTLQLDLGDATLTNCEVDDIDVDASLGDVILTGGSASEGSITDDLGDVNLTEIEIADLTIDASMGDVTVSTANSLADFKMDIKADMGDINVDGQSFDEKMSQKGKDGTLNITDSMGDISVSY